MIKHLFYLSNYHYVLELNCIESFLIYEIKFNSILNHYYML